MRHRLSVAVLLGVCGCYRYVPETDLMPMAGAEYRAHLSVAGSEQMTPLLGRDVVRVDGRVLTVSDTGFLLAVGATTTRTDARPTIWSGEQLVVPRASLERIERRELDRPRTIRAAAIYSLGILVLASLLFSIEGRVSDSGGGTPPPPPP